MGHDEDGGEDSTDHLEAAPGPRRSTFTPPPAAQPEPLQQPSATDDDALADALAADLQRATSGPITVVTPDTVVPPGPAAAPDSQPRYTPSAYSTPAWSGFPAPDPAQAVPLPDGPPARTSMPDEELARWVAEAGDQPGGTLDVIERLQNQMTLREQEVREFRAWEDRMRSLGTPDALGAVASARPQFSGVLPDTADATPAPAPELSEPAAPASPPPLPTWDVAAPSPSWSPPPEWDQAEPVSRVPFDWSSSTMPAPVVDPTPPVEPAPADRQDDDDVVVPTLEPEPPVEVEAPPELTAETVADTGPEPFTPPPLIEPTGFGGPPLLPSQTKAPEPFSFDAALATPPAAAFDLDGLPHKEPPIHPDPEPSDPQPSIETLFIEPMPVAAGEGAPTDTGSITVIDQAYEEDLDDDVDETDRAFDGILGPVSVDTAGIAAMQQPISPPSGPISTVRIPADEQVLYDDEPIRQPVFSIEDSDLGPTPVDHRVGRAARLFWLWFAANSSILSLGLGAAVFAVGMSLRQSIVAILAGVAISFIPLGLTALAGKRSGQPTMVVSRATFGLIGNVVPAIVALITRLFWGAVLLWLLASSVAVVIVGAQLDGTLGERGILLVSLAAAFLIAVLVAFAGYPMVARIQLVLSLISGILIVGLIALTYQYIDIPQALTAADGPWLLTITGAVLVFSFVGLVWANSGADLARYQRPDSSGASSMLWATFGTTVPSFLLIGYGALLAASDKGIATGFLLSPLDTLALMLPSWYPVPLIAATALSLLSGIILSLYSGGFALQSIGIRVKRQWSIVIVGVLLGGLALLLGFGVTGGINELFRDAATTLAVPTAAWAGIFAAETMIRNRRFEGQSLVRRGGVYSDVRWVNLIGLLLISTIGYGLTTATVSWLTWQGYGLTLLGIPLDSDLAGTDMGVLAALVLGLLLPIVAGIPAIRKQEAVRV